MDSNVEKTKKLLEAGYKIIHIEGKYGKPNQPDTFEYIVTLKNRENRELVKSVKSPEFMEFILHFKQAKDKYDNSEFIYDHDLERYGIMTADEQNHMILQDHHKIKISGHDFSQGITTISLKPGGRENRIGTAQIWIDLNKNPDFNNVDFKDEIEIRDNSNTILMRGYIKNYQSSENTGFLSIQDLTLKMESGKVTAEFNRMKPVDSMGLLAEFGEFTFKTDFSYNTTPRAFEVILPVQNLVIDQTFKIGDVEFYQDFTTLDDSMIRKSNTVRTNPLWNGNFPRARILVIAHQFFEAITKGYEAICKAVDVISFRTDWTFPSIDIDDKKIFFIFSYYKYLSRVKSSTLVYCREIETQAHTFFNLESIIDNVLSFDIDSQEYFTPVNQLFDTFLKNNDITDEEGRILQVLHWLRKSIQEGNREDKFLDLWVAFEFLTSGTSMPKLFQPDEVSKLKKLIEKSDLSKEQLSDLQFRLNQLNEPPQMAIFNYLIKTLDVKFTNAEFKILSDARKKRTEIIHGRKNPDIKEEELNKMRTILEKVLIKKISVLKSLKKAV